MAEIRPAVWIVAGAGAALALALPWLAAKRDGDDRAPAIAAEEAGPGVARVWPPPSPVAAAPPPIPRTAPSAPPTREDLRTLWDAEDEAVQLASRYGLDAGFEIAMPPRLAGESLDAHRRRGEALRRQALADVVLAELRMREHYEQSALPNGGMIPEEQRRRFQIGPRGEDPRVRLEALRRATAQLEAERDAADAWESDAS